MYKLCMNRKASSQVAHVSHAPIYVYTITHALCNTYIHI